MLNLLIFIPILAALAIIILRAPPRLTAQLAAALQCGVALLTFTGYDRAAGGFQYQFKSVIVPEWNLSYFLAADGLSVVMLLLTGLVTLAAIAFAPKVEKREGVYFASLLFISAGAAGAFA